MTERIPLTTLEVGVSCVSLTMNKQELATKIWATANELRKNIKASEYKDYILGFMFYKYLCDKEVDYLHDLGGEIEDLQGADDSVKIKFKDGIGYFISHEDLFHTWRKSGIRLGAKEVTDAIEHFYLNLNGRYKTVFDKVFSALQSGLTKLGENAGSRDKAVRDIIDLVNTIPPTSRDYDVLGYIYEYLIKQFSSEAKKDGAFFTPHALVSVASRILAERLKGRDEISIYDPCTGSGGLLLNMGREAERYISTDKIHYYGQELITETMNLAKMNLFMQGIPIQNINMRNANTLAEDWPYFDEQTAYSPLFVDGVLTNPPYSAHYLPQEHQTDERFKGYGLAPEGKADYAFLLHCLYHIKNDGIMAIVLPHGVLFRGASEGEIRKNLILNHNIETIIGCPSGMFFATTIPVVLMILSKNRKADDILFIDASQSYAKEKTQNVLRESDVQRIFDAVVARKDIPNYAHLASFEELERNDFNLNIPRYVSATVEETPYDPYSVMTGKVSDKELSMYDAIWNQFPALHEKLFTSSNGYNAFTNADLKQVVFEDEDVQDFLKSLENQTELFRETLVDALINPKAKPSLYHELTQKTFDDFREIPLTDIYTVFQAFVDSWDGISADLSRLNTEGWSICNEIEPNMVMKKVADKDKKEKKYEEIPEGWRGKIMPFDLIKKELFSADLKEIARLNNDADAAASECTEIWEALDEDVKAVVWKSDEDKSFDEKKYKAAKKEKRLDSEAFEALTEMTGLIAKEKDYRKQAKSITALLDEKAKEKIASLTDEEVHALLECKWITPTIQHIRDTGIAVLNKFVGDMKALQKKYADPMADISSEIETASCTLKASLGTLTSKNDADMEAIKLLMEEL